MKNIILYSHLDVVRNDIPLEFKDGKLQGLLDDYVGQFIALSAMNNPSIRELEKQGRIKYMFGLHEEFGLDVDFPKLDPKTDFVINIDVCCGKRYKGKDIGLENLYGKGIAEALNGLEWEGYKFYFSEWKNDPAEADACDQFAAKKIPCVSFIIPIEAPGDNWHGKSTIEYTKIMKAIQILVRLVCYLS